MKTYLHWLMLAMILALSALYYMAEEGRRSALRTNQFLSTYIVTADAKTELVADAATGDVYIRINDTHVHLFPRACPPVIQL